MRQIYFLLLAAVAAMAQPRVSAVVNGADLTAAVAPGSLAAALGTGLAGAPVFASGLPLPATLGGVSVSVGGRAARLSYVSPTQILFQVPAGVPAGSANVTVTSGTATSTAVPATVAATAPGVFRYGVNHGVIQNQDFSLNGPGSAAPAGSTVIVYLTGIGATDPAVPDGAAAPTSGAPAVPLAAATATIGGVTANLSFIGLAPGEVGLAQANLVIPAVPAGDQPLVISVNGVASKSVLITVSAGGGSGGGTGGGGGTTPTVTGPPEGLQCVSGTVESIVYSLQYKMPGLADEIVVGGTRICPDCEVKPPLYVQLVQQLERAREDGTTVDACYGIDSRVNALQLRR